MFKYPLMASFFLTLFLLTHFSCSKEKEALFIQYVSVGDNTLDLFNADLNIDAPIYQPILAGFNLPLDTVSAKQAISLSTNGQTVPVVITFGIDNRTIILSSNTHLLNNQKYHVNISSQLKAGNKAAFDGIDVAFTTVATTLAIDTLTLNNGSTLLTSARVTDVPLNLSVAIHFTKPIDYSSLNSTSVRIAKAGYDAPISFSLSPDNQTLHLNTSQPLTHFEKYQLSLSSTILGTDGSVFSGFNKEFYTGIDPTPKFPLLSDEDLLTKVQRQTFKYFWDFGHPVSGLSPERNATPNVVTIGGTGFGLMAILVGIERGFITRQEGVERLQTMFNFLATADRFHGVWPHWMNGATGETIPFSPKDNGADLVETSYLVQGMLCVRQYLNPDNPTESQLITQINDLWHGVEWDWFTRGGQNKLYWHWSPSLEWEMNFPINGYNEALITYFLAAASPTHSIEAAVYHNGWANNGGIANGQSFYGYTLPVGYNYGGPLFFAHYSFLGIDPNNLSDQYANYWTQNQNHTLINRAYCIDNPKNFVGYSSQCWGLTASDNNGGYSAHSPTNDLGVITPTAAISSIPFTPEYSLEAIRFFYYTIGDKTWGEYGFYDSFNPTQGWFGKSTLAIDQGPIIIMIENYRSQLLWNLFMSCPEVEVAMTKLGFTN